MNYDAQIHDAFLFYHVPENGKPCECTCTAIHERNCIMKGCPNRFLPHCHAEIFCSFACFLASGALSLWKTIKKYKDQPGKLRKKISKIIYRLSKKGREARARESELYREKLKNQPPEIAAVEIPVSPDLVVEPEPEKRKEETLLSPVENEMDDILSEEDYVILETVDFQCKRPGCKRILDARLFLEFGKRYCCDDCRDAVRNLRAILKRAYALDRCPGIFFALCLLRAMG